MFKNTMAALGGICVDVAAFTGALCTETAQAGCEMTAITAEFVGRTAHKGVYACSAGSQAVESWRRERKAAIRDWAARTEQTWGSDDDLQAAYDAAQASQAQHGQHDGAQPA